MQNIALVTHSAIGVLLSLVISAQGTLQVSSIDDLPSGSVSIGSDSWIAQRFYIVPSDTNTYALDSVELLLELASGNPSDFRVSIYQGTGVPGGGPQNELVTLTGPSDPASGRLAYILRHGIHCVVQQRLLCCCFCSHTDCARCVHLELRGPAIVPAGELDD